MFLCGINNFLYIGVGGMQKVVGKLYKHDSHKLEP